MNVKAVEKLQNRLYTPDRDETTAVLELMVAEESLPLNSMRWVKVMKTVLLILDLFDSDPDVDALVCSGVKGTKGHGGAHIVVIFLDELELIVLRRW